MMILINLDVCFGPPKFSEPRTKTRQQALSIAEGADRRISSGTSYGPGRLSRSPDGRSQRELFSFLAQNEN